MGAGFIDMGTSAWSSSSVSELVNGTYYDYYVYTFNGDDRGSVKLIIKFLLTKSVSLQSLSGSQSSLTGRLPYHRQAAIQAPSACCRPAGLSSLWNNPLPPRHQEARTPLSFLQYWQ